MGLYKKLMELGGRPTGILGRIAGGLMNRGHAEVHHWGLSKLPLAYDATVLDIGCGGGSVVRLLAERLTEGKAVGIDHSPDMVNLSRKANNRLIRRGRVSIDHGSVSHLPYADALFDAATAFETIQFWPDLMRDLAEVMRVLKPCATLLVINRLPPSDEKGKWIKMLQVRTANEYHALLEEAGFVNVQVDDTSMAGWICVTAMKPEGTGI